MNINIQKAIRCTTSILAVLAVVLISFPTPASALDSYQPKNYISDIKVDGDIKTVTYLFDNGLPVTNFWETPGGAKIQNNSKVVTYMPTDGTTSFTARSYYLGAEAYDNGSMPLGHVIDVGDIKDQAPVAISSRFSMQTWNIASTGMPSTITPIVSMRYSYGFFAYDKTGAYIGTYYGTATTVTIEPGKVYDFSARYEDPLPSGIKYMLPFNSFNGTMANGSMDNLGLSMNFWFFQMDVDINMIYEQSQTMGQIKDKLGDIEEEIGDVGDKIDDTNDKLDEIISGGEAATEASEVIEDLDEDIDGFNDLMQDKEDLEDDLPTTPTSFQDVIDEDVLDGAITDAGKIMDWESSGLNRMFAPMGLSVGLSILFYVVFGKKG